MLELTEGLVQWVQDVAACLPVAPNSPGHYYCHVLMSPKNVAISSSTVADGDGDVVSSACWRVFGK